MSLAQANHNAITHFQPTNRVAHEWDSPTPISRTNNDLSLLLFSTEAIPSPDFSSSIRSFNPHQLHPATSSHTPRSSLSKSWAGKPTTKGSLSFNPFSTSTPSKHSRKRIPLFNLDENDEFVPEFDVAELSVPMSTARASLSSSTSAPQSWNARGAYFKRFPGSHLPSMVKVPPIYEGLEIA